MTPTENTPASTPEPSFDELRQMLTDDVATAAPETIADPEPAAEEAPEPTSVEEEGTTEPASEPEIEDEPLPKGAQRKIQKEIDRAIAARKEVEQLRDELARQKPQVTEPDKKPELAQYQPNLSTRPDQSKYNDYDKYVEDLTDWKIEQRENARAFTATQKAAVEAHREVMTAWDARERAIKLKHADYAVTLQQADIPILPEMRRALLKSEVGPELTYHLAKHPDECKRIAALEPVDAVRELGKLEGRLTATPPTPKPAAAPLPRPPAVVPTGGAPAEVDLSTCDMRTFKRELTKILR